MIEEWVVFLSGWLIFGLLMWGWWSVHRGGKRERDRQQREAAEVQALFTKAKEREAQPTIRQSEGQRIAAPAREPMDSLLRYGSGGVSYRRGAYSSSRRGSDCDDLLIVGGLAAAAMIGGAYDSGSSSGSSSSDSGSYSGGSDGGGGSSE